MRYNLFALLLCLTSLMGCSTATVTVTSTGSTTSTTSVASTPTSVPAPAGLNTIDWQNTSYPDMCHINGGNNVTVTNGFSPEVNHIKLQVLDPVFGYITRSNQLDVMVPYTCIGIMDSGNGLLVFSGNASNPTVVGKLPLAASKYPMFSVLTEAIISHKLELQGYGYSSGAVPQCCPDVTILDTYTWNGSAFTLSSHQANTLGAQLYP